MARRMGTSEKVDTVTIYGKQRTLSSVLSISGKKDKVGPASSCQAREYRKWLRLSAVSCHGYIHLALSFRASPRFEGHHTTVGSARLDENGAPAPSPHPLRLILNVTFSGTQCTLMVAQEPAVLVAQFMASPPFPGRNGTPMPPAMITILPSANKYSGLVDQIVLSALIIERSRLTNKISPR